MKRIIISILVAILLLPMSIFAQEGTSMVSLGASLTGEDKEFMLSIFGVNQSDNVISIDGNTVNKYLNDGTDNTVGIYSSSKVEFMPKGFGVEVFVITPENITKVSESAYRNAAIAAGATNAYIQIASPQPVTGEGALAGVYEIFSQQGIELNPEDIRIAENQIKIEQLLTEETSLNSTEISKIITKLNYEIMLLVEKNKEIKDEDLFKIVESILNDGNYSIPKTAIEAMKEHAIAFAKSETARDSETKRMLEEMLNIFEKGDFSHIKDKKYTVGNLEIEFHNVYLTEERNEYSEEKFDNVLVAEYTVTNNSEDEFYSGNELSLFTDGKTTMPYFMGDESFLPIPSGKSGDEKMYFGFNGDFGALELQLKDIMNINAEPVNIILTGEKPSTEKVSSNTEETTAIIDTDPSEFINSIENKELKEIMQGFVDNKLNVLEPYMAKRTDLGMAPYTTDNMVFFGAQLAVDPVTDENGETDPYNYGRLFFIEDEEDMKLQKAYYDDLAKQSALFYSHTYQKGNVLLQMGGDVPDEDFEKYIQVIDQIIK